MDRLRPSKFAFWFFLLAMVLAAACAFAAEPAASDTPEAAVVGWSEESEAPAAVDRTDAAEPVAIPADRTLAAFAQRWADRDRLTRRERRELGLTSGPVLASLAKIAADPAADELGGELKYVVAADLRSQFPEAWKDARLDPDKIARILAFLEALIEFLLNWFG